MRAVYRAAQDLRGAVRYLCERSAQYRIDTSAIFLSGSSAGCFSALHSCFMEPSDVPAAVQGIPLEPSDLGCYDCAVNADNNHRMPQIRGIMNHWGAIIDTIFIRPTAKDNVPVISLSGDQDNLVPYGTGHPFSYPVFPTVYGSEPIHARLTHLGVKNELHPLYGQGHEPWLLAPRLLDTCFKYEKPFLYTILKPATLAISGDTVLCAGDTATYRVAGREGSHYCWDFAGGNMIRSSGTVTIRWMTAGPHLITAREMTRNDVNGDLDSLYINVVSRPEAIFGATVAHTAVAFSDSSVGATSWLYSFGDGAQAATASPAHTYGRAGTFTASLSVSNGHCADTAYRTITTDTCPAVHIHYIISQDTIYVAAEPADARFYSWTFGDGDSATGAETWHVYDHTQNYLVALTLQTAMGCVGFISEIVAYQQPLGLDRVGEERYHIYPNPAHDQIGVRCTDCTIAVYDCLGRLVLSKYELTTPIVDISALDAGIYNVSVTAGGRIAFSRLIIR